MHQTMQIQRQKLMLRLLTLFIIASMTLALSQDSQYSIETHRQQLPPFQSISALPYQAHSFNDVEYIRRLLLRGVKVFKIDVSLANRESCQKHSSWNASQQCFSTQQYAEQYCCLAMRGDTSGRNDFDFPFSTLQDFVDMLGKFLSQHPIRSEILMFAINFQFSFEFSNQLVEDSLFKLAELMQQYPKLHVGTGTDSFILEYDRVCRNALLEQRQGVSTEEQIIEPLSKLNQEICTPQRKAISASKFFLQSGSDSPSDVRDYYDRYRNFNTFYKDIESRCQKGFPSWIRKHPEYPLIFWEPSDERQIQYVLGLFLSEKCQLLHGRNLSGLAITSNIEPEVFEFYLKSLRDEGQTDDPISFEPDSEKLALKYGSTFMSALSRTSDGASQQNFAILLQQDAKHSMFDLTLLQADSTDSTVFQKQRVMQEQGGGEVTKVVGGNNSLAVIQKVESSQSKESKISLLDAHTFETIVEPVLPYFVDMSYLRGNFYILKQTANPTVFNIIRTADLVKNSIISSFSISLEKAESIESFLAFTDTQGTLRFILSGSIDNRVWVGEIERQELSRSSHLTYGANSRLYTKDSGSFLLVVEGGTCNSGSLVNNGDTPLCSYYEYPSTFGPLTKTRHTVNALQFTYDGLSQHFSEAKGKPVSPCTPNFLFYKLMNGKSVSLVDYRSRIMVSSEYVPVSQLGLMNSLFCAASNFQTLQKEEGEERGILGSIWSRSNLESIVSIEKPASLTLIEE